jgi:CheY-like chemotaxis protein
VAVPRYLIATDADWILDEVRAALEGPDTTIAVCRSGKQVVPTAKELQPDLCILDLQIGTMGGMAVTMELRLEESGGRLPHIPVLMLLDRHADTFLRKAAATITSGGTIYEGMPSPVAPEADGGDTATEGGTSAPEGGAEAPAGADEAAPPADGAEALSG